MLGYTGVSWVTIGVKVLTMLSLVTANRFDRRMTNGKTKPALMACERSDGSEVEAVVKFSFGCELGLSGLATEAIAAMFAADLELPIPEPLLVAVDPEFVSLIPDDEVRSIAEKSSPIAFGSCLLPSSYSVWIHTRTIPADLQQQALEIFAFDALVLNADRRTQNPNCQSNGKTFGIYDHELCFVPPLFSPDPWQEGGLEYLRTSSNHLFQQGLHGTSLNLDRLVGAVESVTPNRIAKYLAAIPAEWVGDNRAISQAAIHLNGIRDNIESAITEVIRVLS